MLSGWAEISAPRAAPGLREDGASSDGSWRFNSASAKHKGANPIIKPHDSAAARSNASNTFMRARFGLSDIIKFMLCSFSGSSFQCSLPLLGRDDVAPLVGSRCEYGKAGSSGGDRANIDAMSEHFDGPAHDE